MSNLKLAFILEAIDKATAPLRKVGQAVDRINEPAKRVSRSMDQVAFRFGRLMGFRLQRQWGEISERGRALSNSAQGVANTLGVVTIAAGSAFYAMKRTVDEIDRANEAANKLGMSIEVYQKMGYAAEQTGSSQEDMGQALKFLSQNMVQAINGSKEATEWFGRVGIPLDKLKQMNAGEVFETIADKFQAVGDVGQNAQKKIAVMMALMGRSGTELKQTLDQGSDGLRGLYKEAVRLGAVVDGPTADAFSQFNDNFGDMKKSIVAVMTSITKAALPALDSIVKKITEMGVAGRVEWGEKIGLTISNIVNALPGFFAQMGKIAGAMVMIAGAAHMVAQAMGGWQNVIYVVATLISVKLAIGVYALGTAMLAIIPTIWTLGFALMATPLGWFLAAIALIAGAVYLIYRNWEPIKGFFAGIWGAIKPAAMVAWNFLRFLFSWSPLGLLVNNWGAITGWMGVLWDAVAGVVASALGLLKDVVASGLALIGGLLLQWAPVRLVMAAWGPVITFLKEVWKTISDIVGPILNAVGGAAKAVGGLAMDKFGGNTEQNYGLRIEAPSALPTGRATKADVGGTLKIRIDQEGRARVAEVKSNNPDVDYSVYTGMSMAGA